MSDRPLVIFGAGDLARIACLYFEAYGGRAIGAFCVDELSENGTPIEDKPLISPEGLAADFPPDSADVFIAVGYKKVNHVRRDLFQRFKQLGYTLASYVDPTVRLWPGTTIGENVFILENNVIQPGVTLGDNVFIWSSNHIGHDASVADHCFISSEVCIAGHATIEARCFLGVGATIRDGITIGEGCVLGPGAIMLHDAEAGGVYLPEETQRHRIPSHRLRGL